MRPHALYSLFALCCLCVYVQGSALAQQSVAPTSYDTLNGGSGAYNYWDDTYNGSGDITKDYAPLTGGLGDLTDGVIATNNWFVTEAPPGPGPYVAWLDFDPTITFHFASVTDFQNVRIYFDDADGAGAVSAPRGVIINGAHYLVADPLGSAPFFADFDVSSLANTDQLSIQLLRGNRWVFASEFQFMAVGQQSVPEPGTLVMLFAGGLTAANLLRCRKAVEAGNAVV